MDQQPGVACQRRFCVLIATSLKRQKGEAALKYVIVITGASSGFGALTARRLAEAGHTVYATMRETGGRNAKQVEAARKFAAEKNVDLRTAELDVSSQESADRAVQQVLGAAGRLDIIIHNAGHMVFGPAEAFTPEQLAEIYDANVLSTQRVNRAALPILRKQGGGLVIWVGSSSTRGGTPPYLAPYFAAKAGMDAIVMRANWLGGKSKAQSSYPEHSRLAPITSRTLGSPATPVALTSIHPARLRSRARRSCRGSYAQRFPTQTLLKWRMRS